MNKLLILAITFVLSGCEPTPLKIGSEQVEVSHDSPRKGCKLVAQVIGSEGNFFTGELTSNKNLEIGALNDLRNNAYRIGANYVKLLSNRASQSGGFSSSNGYGSGSSSQVSVTYVGNAYACNE